MCRFYSMKLTQTHDFCIDKVLLSNNLNYFLHCATSSHRGPQAPSCPFMPAFFSLIMPEIITYVAR